MVNMNERGKSCKAKGSLHLHQVIYEGKPGQVSARREMIEPFSQPLASPRCIFFEAGTVEELQCLNVRYKICAMQTW